MAPPWKNLIEPFDVSDDWYISPIDALLIIDELNNHGSHTLPPPDDNVAPPPYLDVSGDGNVSPIDVLWIINYLNGAAGNSTFGGSSSGGSGESGGGEGEAAVWIDALRSPEPLGLGTSTDTTGQLHAALSVRAPDEMVVGAGADKPQAAAAMLRYSFGTMPAARSPNIAVPLSHTDLLDGSDLQRWTLSSDLLAPVFSNDAIPHDAAAQPFPSALDRPPRVDRDEQAPWRETQDWTAELSDIESEDLLAMIARHQCRHLLERPARNVALFGKVADVVDEAGDN